LGCVLGAENEYPEPSWLGFDIRGGITQTEEFLVCRLFLASLAFRM
jgi:hypothetical protein